MTGEERRQANRAFAVSAAGLAATGLVGLLIAVLTGSAGLLGDAIHLPPGAGHGQLHLVYPGRARLTRRRARGEIN